MTGGGKPLTIPNDHGLYGRCNSKLGLRSPRCPFDSTAEFERECMHTL